MKSVSKFIETRLKLKVNQSKNALAKQHERKFLGFSFTTGNYAHKRRIAPQATEKFKNRIRHLTGRSLGVSFEKRIMILSSYLNGWIGYFGHCETPSVLEKHDSWIRRRLRSALWEQWKTYSGRKTALIKRGTPRGLACNTAWETKGTWHMSKTLVLTKAIPNSFFDTIKLPKLAPTRNIQPN